MLFAVSQRRLFRSCAAAAQACALMWVLYKSISARSSRLMIYLIRTPNLWHCHRLLLCRDTFVVLNLKNSIAAKISRQMPTRSAVAEIFGSIPRFVNPSPDFSLYVLFLLIFRSPHLKCRIVDFPKTIKRKNCLYPFLFLHIMPHSVETSFSAEAEIYSFHGLVSYFGQMIVQGRKFTRL